MKSLVRGSLRSVSGVVMVLLLFSCNGDSPTAPPSLQPTPPAANNAGFVWGYVHDESGVCIQGAVVEVLDGPRAGTKSTQNGPCSVWDSDGGYSFRDLPSNTNVRMRASKQGFQSQEMTFFATTYGGNQSSFLLVPE